MTIAELGSIGEFLGSFAVLATLVYLAIQVRHARSEARRTAQVARSQGVRDSWLNRVQNPELLDAMIKAEQSLGAVFLEQPFVRILVESGGLSYREAYLVLSDQIIQWQNWVATVENLEDQSPAAIQRMNAAMRTFYKTGYARYFWERQLEANVETKTIKYVEKILAT